MHAVAQFALSYVAPFMFVLLLVITVHELGHFWAGKAFGVAIERFSFGFGRAIVRWRDRSGVEWRVGWIPIGGYVMFAGDENAASVPDQNDLESLRRSIVAREGPAALKRYLPFKPIWQRAIVSAAGPAANFLLATAIFAILFATIGEPSLRAKVGGVVPGSPAAAAGFQAGDIVIKAGGHGIASFEQLHEIVSLRAGEAMSFTVQRGPAQVVLSATPRVTTIDNPLGGKDTEGELGLQSSRDAADVVQKRYGPVAAIGAGAARTWDVLSTTVFYLSRLVTGHESGKQLTSIIGIAQASHVVVVEGARGAHGLGEQILGAGVALLSLAAIVSCSIGFANLLPIPVLDGGHLAFYAYEAIARRPVAASVQAVSYRVGLALLLGLMLFATTNDLQRINLFHFLRGPFS